MSVYGGRSAASPGARTNGLAVAGLVCGILGLFFLSFVLGPLAIIFGAIALRQKTGSLGMAKAGLILGIVDVVLFIVLLAVVASGGFSWYVGG
ncbi:DUF4190 domain-containing protein [Streptomyces sp. NPDC048518]|uniref:DUF4190 domain-containing protein n=1 Tax=Streptomyces sp. NPDC048518 TaxID=3155029 RepID=UPI0033F6F7FF